MADTGYLKDNEEILASRLRLADEKLLKAMNENAGLRTEIKRLRSEIQGNINRGGKP